VIVLDNLSREKLLGVSGQNAEYNWNYLRQYSSIELIRGSVLDINLLAELIPEVDAVLHAAGQTAVTTSASNPALDFETNLVGTFRVLDAVRCSGRRLPIVFTSTNKVYGDNVNDLPICEGATRYSFDGRFALGVPESLPVDGCKHSPYGVSKLSADLYVQEYARLYGIPTAAFRMSCIYGPRQMGVEDQGWVAHFVISSLTKRPITIYGDGKQARDLLHVDDLIRAIGEFFGRALEFPQGIVCNVGGGPGFVMSLLELLAFLESETGYKAETRFSDWRPSDQRVYVSDIRRIKTLLSWWPRISPQEGIRSMIQWVSQNISLFQ
jgi:CDP-paratose 2-epimerase